MLVSGVQHSDLLVFFPDYIPLQIITRYWISFPVCACSAAQSGVTLCPPVSFSHGIIPGKRTGGGCHVLLQGVFPTRVSCVSSTGRWVLYHWATRETPDNSLYYVVESLLLYFRCSNLYLLPLYSSLLSLTNPFGNYVFIYFTWVCFCFVASLVFFYSTFKWHHIVFVFLCLT